MSIKKNNTVQIIVSTIIAAVFIAAAAYVVINRQRVVDQINFWEYKPTSEMTSFAQRTSMNSEGQFLFYSAKPELESQADFNVSCPNTNSSMAIIGCYNGQQIFIYNITNAKLDGIRDVTAAYEMLHAAYKRLSPSDLTAVNQLIENEYQRQGNDSMKNLVSYFAKTEPGERDNELFSMIATQLPSISPQLESYYSRYFTNRQTLVSLYNKYSSVFKTLSDQSTQLAAGLKVLSSSIDARSTKYVTDNTKLNDDIQTFNKNATDGNFSSQSDFNQQRNALSARSTALDAERTSINNDIATYNDELAQYNALAVQTKQLYNSINSLAAASSVN